MNELQTSRANMLTKVRAVHRTSGLVPLAQMDSLEQWLSVRKERGFDATYPFAFLVLDFLVERHSYPQVLDYFRRHRDSRDPAANFSAAFGEGLPAFQSAVDRHFAKLLE